MVYYYDEEVDKLKYYSIHSTPICYLLYVTDIIPNKNDVVPPEPVSVFSVPFISRYPSFDTSDIVDYRIIDKEEANRFIIEFESRDVKFITNNLRNIIDNYGAKKLNCYSLLKLLPKTSFKINMKVERIHSGIYYAAIKIINDVENGILSYFEDEHYKINPLVNKLIFYLLSMRNDDITLDIFLNFMEFKPKFIITDKIKKYPPFEYFERILSFQKKMYIEKKYLKFTKYLIPNFGTRILDLMTRLGFFFLPSDEIIPECHSFSKDEYEYLVSNNIGTKHLVNLIIGYHPADYNIVPWLLENGCEPILCASSLDYKMLRTYEYLMDKNITVDVVEEIIDKHIEKVKNFDSSEMIFIGLLCIESGKNLDNFINFISKYGIKLDHKYCYWDHRTAAAVIYIWKSMETNEEIFDYLLDNFTSYNEFVKFYSTYYPIENKKNDKFIKIMDKIFENITIDSVFKIMIDEILKFDYNCDPFDDDSILYHVRKYLRYEHMEFIYNEFCIEKHDDDFKKNNNVEPNYIYNYFENGYSNIVIKYVDKSINNAITPHRQDIKTVHAITELIDPRKWITNKFIKLYVRYVDSKENDTFISWCKNNIPERFYFIYNKVIAFKNGEYNIDDDDDDEDEDDDDDEDDDEDEDDEDDDDEDDEYDR